MKIRLLSILSAILIILCSTSVIYADDNSNDWLYIQQIASDKQSAVFLSAFKAYMNANSSYLTFSYNQQKAIVNFTYDKLNEIQKSLGIGSIPSYYNQIACAVDNNGTFKFYYTASGLKFMDDLLKGVLDYYDIDVTDMSKDIYQGEWWEDVNGNGCYIYHCNNEYYFSGNNYNYAQYYQYFVKKVGTPYIYDNTIITQLYNNAIHGDGNSTFSITFNPTSNVTESKTFYCRVENNVTCYYSASGEKAIMHGYRYTNLDTQFCIFKWDQNTNSYHICALNIFNDNNNTKMFCAQNMVNFTPSNDSLKNQLINLAKEGANAVLPAVGKSASIDVGKYGGDAVTSALDHLTDTTKKKPDIDPVDDPINPPDVNPPGVNIPVGIVNNMPINIQLPNLNDLIPDPINNLPQGFHLPGLRYKFPFCIPFDLIAVYEVLDQTPSAPHFETNINFASFNYDLVIDLQEYNPYMVHIRNYFLILYIFGLLFITPKLLKA